MTDLKKITERLKVKIVLKTENLLNDIKQLKIDVRKYLATLKVDSSTAVE